jgi:hypothetical protein
MAATSMQGSHTRKMCHKKKTEKSFLSVALKGCLSEYAKAPRTPGVRSSEEGYAFSHYFSSTSRGAKVNISGVAFSSKGQAPPPDSLLFTSMCGPRCTVAGPPWLMIG